MRTKERILNEALKQFSVKGYAGTSMSEIAKPLGITKAALYKHFVGKQEIFDTILEESRKRYESLLEGLSVHISDENVDKKDVEFFSGLSPEKLAASIVRLIKRTMTDSYSTQVRHMLALTQFNTPELGRIYTNRYAESMLLYDEKLFRTLMDAGIMKKDDVKEMALWFCTPIFTYIGIWDRNPERAEECIEAIDKHVRYFFEKTRATDENGQYVML